MILIKFIGPDSKGNCLSYFHIRAIFFFKKRHVRWNAIIERANFCYLLTLLSLIQK